MFFFFKQKTAYEMRISDWSSDVCSSDLSLHPSRFAVMSGAMLKALSFGLRALWDDGAHLARHDDNRASGFGTRKGEDSDQREPIGRSGGLTDRKSVV